jgi:hypothetical protein
MAEIAPEEAAALAQRVRRGEPLIVVAREAAQERELPTGAVLQQIRRAGRDLPSDAE